MLVLRDFRQYLGRLVTHDWYQAVLVVVSTAVLVISYLDRQIEHHNFALSTDWALLTFGIVLMFSGFRLWRDERLIAEHEGEQLRAIARRMRNEIETQEGSHYRMFSYAEDPRDRSHHERMFQKHLPKIAEAAEAWLTNPDTRDAASVLMNTKLLTQMSEAIPATMRQSVANAICTYVEESLFYSAAPPGRFDVELVDFKGREATRALRFQDRPGQYALFNVGSDLEGVDQIALELNQLSVATWGSAEGEIWRELVRLNWRSREQLSDYLTDVINGHRLTRKHCDRECYELSSGD